MSGVESNGARTEPAEIAHKIQSPSLRLELPSEEHVESFFEAMQEFSIAGDPQVPEGMTRADLPAYVQQLHDLALGKNLKEGYVRSKEFWIVDSDGYAGRIILGLEYWPSPDRIGHHVGYAIRPSKRRRGYATEALRCLIDEARQLKIFELMPICDFSNIASRKVIERNGGVLLDPEPETPGLQGSLRFLISVGEPVPGEAD